MKKQTVRFILVGDINVLPQIRKIFDDNSLKHLAANIAQHGILQPLLVTQVGDRYTLLAGERRLRAARLAGLKIVPCIVIDSDDPVTLQLVENTQRKNLTPLEEATALHQLRLEKDLTIRGLAEVVNMKKSTIARKLKLLSHSGTEDEGNQHGSSATKVVDPFVRCYKDGSVKLTLHLHPEHSSKLEMILLVREQVNRPMEAAGLPLLDSSDNQNETPSDDTGGFVL